VAIKFTQVLDLANQRITNIGSPSSGTDAVNKSYVDNVVQGLDWKQSVRVATTGNVNLASPGAVIDGVTLTAGDRVLVMSQTDATQNGIYVWNGAASAATRATDADSNAEVTAGLTTSVEQGTVNGGKTYILFSDMSAGVGTAPASFTVMTGGSGGTTYSAGNGLALGGSTFSVVAGNGITVGADVKVDPAVVVRKYAANVGDNVSATISVSHNLATRDVTVQLYSNATPWDTVFCEVTRPDINTVTLGFAAAPASGAYRVVVHG
jgi:hypothetical protein